MISPLFDLALLELFELLTILAAIGPTGAAITIWATHWREQKRQASVDSARLIFDIDNQLRSCEFREVLNQVQHGWGEQFNKDKYRIHVIRYINILNTVCIMQKNGAITKEYMEIVYDLSLIAFDNNDWVHSYLEQMPDYSFMVNRINKIRKKTGKERQSIPLTDYTPSECAGKYP